MINYNQMPVGMAAPQQFMPQVMPQNAPQAYQYTPPAAPLMPNMQYGLQGSESALGAGYQQALSGIQGGVDMASQALLGSTGQGVNTGLAGQQMYGNQAINALQGAQNYNQNLGAQALGAINGANQQQQMYGNQALGNIGNAIGAQQQFGNQALGALNNAYGAQQMYGNQAIGGINSALGSQQQYANKALEAINSAISSASGSISGGIDKVGTAFDEGVSALNQYLPIGMSAFNQIANLSGVGENGTAGQQEAYNNYMESPDVAFLREQGERSVLQNARAAGGVGGNVLKELQRYGTGVASQGFNDYYNRLKGVSDVGVNASQSVGALRGQQAGIVGNLSSQAAQNAMQGGQMTSSVYDNLSNGAMQGAQLSSNIYGNLGNSAMQGAQLASGIYGDLGSGGFQGAQLSSNVLGNMGSNSMQNANAAANIYGNLGSNATNTAGNMANVYGDLGAGSMNASNSLANMYNNAGQSAGDYAYGTGQLLSGGRLQAGRDISGIQQAQGQGLSNIVGGGASNIAQLLSGVGDSINSQQGNLASILASLAGAASGGGNQTSSAQFLNNQGIAEQLAKLLEGIGTAAKVSDARLKKNIQHQGSVNGINFYSWDWNDEGLKLAGDQIGFGVIAQELLGIKPDAVSLGDDGYLRVNYSMVI